MTTKNIIITENNNLDYTEEGIIQKQAELTAKSKEMVTSMYTMEELTGVETHLKAQLRATKTNKLRLIGETPSLSGINAAVSKDIYKTFISSFNEEEKRNAWLFYNLEQRDIAITTILSHRQKLHNLVKNTLAKIFTEILHKQNNKLSMGEVLNAIKLKVNGYKTKDGEEHPLSIFGLEEIKLQLVHELSVLNMLDIKLRRSFNKGIVYDISIPKARINKITREEIDYLTNLSHLIKYNTILVKPPRINTERMMSHSSWYYETPELSESQIDFINTMQSIKWKFKPGAEKLIEEAYKRHLALQEQENIFVSPEWIHERIREFKNQIRTSNANGGHYVRGVFDGSLRWYWQAEIGHNQLSKYLRELITIDGIENIVKYDMTNSVVQMYALGLHDKTLASYVGLVAEKDRQADLRTIIADNMNRNLGINTFNKDNIKPLFMVWAYNGGRNTLMNDSYTIKARFLSENPIKEVTRPGLLSIAQAGNSNIKEDRVWQVFEGLLYKLTPSIVDLKKYMNILVNDNPFTIAKWTLPDGAIAQYASVDDVSEPLHWVTEDGKTKQYTAHKKILRTGVGNAGLLPRIIHSIDAYAMRQIVLKCKAAGFTVVPNHDAYMFDEKHTKEFMSIVKEVFIDIKRREVLRDITEQLRYTKAEIRITPSKRIPLEEKDILEGEPVYQKTLI